MGFFKRLFGLEKEEIKENQQTNSEAAATEIQTSQIPPTQREYLNIKCELCHEDIGSEKRRKVAGKLCHKRCIKEHYNRMREQGKAI